jgi:hypothetical protein
MAENEATGTPAPSKDGQRPQATKREYKSPVLVAYGSVRQLTGGASGPSTDVGGMFGGASGPRTDVGGMFMA